MNQEIQNHDELLDAPLYRREVEDYDSDEAADEADNFSDEDEVW